jgi:hypothetical protein
MNDKLKTNALYDAHKLHNLMYNIELTDDERIDKIKNKLLEYNKMDKNEYIKLVLFGMAVGLVIFALFGLAIAGFG